MSNETDSSEEFFRERLDEILMRQGYSTNRKVRRLVQTHELRVNGQRVLVPGTKVSLRHDEITLDGKPVDLQEDIYLVMNKAADCLCTNHQDDHKTVFDYLPENYKLPHKSGPLHTVGRLDGNTEGLLILTTNGDFSHSLVIPETHVDKTYFIGLKDCVAEETARQWIEKCSAGLWLPEVHSGPSFVTKPAVLDWEKALKQKEAEKFGEGKCCLLTISEGKFHQVKRMIKVLGNEVIYLKRISIGAFTLPEELNPGQFRELTDRELLLLSSRN